MAEKGLLEWANYMRCSMVSDPGRKLFQEQVQTHGFSFLDDYLDNILSGAKQDPLIELVKTPGRRKAISRKPKLGSKMQVVTILPEVDEVDDTIERLAPSSSIIQVLLSATNQSSISKPDPELVSPESTTIFSHSETKRVSNESVIPPFLELSVINEDDEGIEHSRTSIQTAQMASGDDVAPTQTQTQDDRTSVPRSHCPNQKSRGLEPPIDSTFHENKGKEAPTVIDITVPLRNSGSESSSLFLSTRKSVLSTLPTLPDPILSRKSIRATKETSVGNVLLGTVTPGNTSMGKRTSWLMKAREAKAMESMPKKPVVNNLPIISTVLAGIKRSSEEVAGPVDIEKEERSSKKHKDETAPTKSASAPSPKSDSKLVEETPLKSEQDDGMLDLLKKKVEGLGARNDKLSDKVLQDTAAALVEARAKAEARIAERHHQEGASTNNSISDAAVGVAVDQIQVEKATEKQQRFSIHDLFPSEGKMKDKSKGPPKLPVFATPQSNPNDSTPVVASDESISATPPHSPPSQVVPVKAVPVFNKPHPVFAPPTSNPRPLPVSPTSKETTFALPSGVFTKLPTVQLGISPIFSSPLGNKTRAIPSNVYSSTMDTESNDLFDNRGNTEAWMPKIQEAEYSGVFVTQLSDPQQLSTLDDDDSWPIDEKLSHGRPWPFGSENREDSLTWSTLPSLSQRVDTGPNLKGGKAPEEGQAHEAQPIPGESDEDMDIEQEDFGAGKEVINTDHDLEEIILNGAKSVQPGNNTSRNSLVSPVSSESQIGFFGQASKFLSSALGTSKKGKPEVKKVTQMATLATKKHENDDKKAARLKEVENHRQLAIRRKAEEEKIRQQEQGRKAKEGLERRKKEREEQMEKKPLKPIAVSISLKRDDEIMKKRKMNSEKPEKKLEPKKQIPPHKTGLKPALKQTSALSSSAAFNASQSSQSTAAIIKPAEKPSKAPTVIPAKGKTKQKLVIQVEEEHTQPSQIVQTQMAARAKAAMQAEVHIPSESIELPEVNSEYSDSEDEGRPRTFNPPDWAQSPELHQALEAQSTINPDDIFGAIRPLRMEELFKARTSRFRARTSSANWSGADRLTVEEEREYARRMGFK